MRLGGSSFLLVVLFVLAGCARESAEEYLLKNAVRKYNRALVETYRMVDPSLLADVAGEAEVRKVDVLITTLQMQNKVLRASLDRIRFVGIERPGEGQAAVKTREDWSYEHVDRKTRQQLGAAKRIRYELAYSLERRGGKWIVTGLRHDRERGSGSTLTRVLTRPGFFGTRAPVLPDVSLAGLLTLVPTGLAAIWSRKRGVARRYRWAMAGAYACLLVAGAAWAGQSLLLGNPEARETLSPFLTWLVAALAVLVPAVLLLAVMGGGIVLYRAFHDPERLPQIVVAPFRIVSLVTWSLIVVAGVAQYWLLFVA